MDNEKSSGSRVVLITGASSGFGEACALHLYEQGYRVFGTSRNAAFQQKPIRQNSDSSYFKMIPMDVQNQESVEKGVAHVLDQEDRIDILVNNAGFAIAGAVEDLSIEEVKNQFETNFFGVLRVCKVVLPQMRERGEGYIINISSLGGLMGLPFQGAYSATKFALEGITESLRIEVKPFGVKVVLLEPGDFKTDITKNRIISDGSKKDTVYSKTFQSTLAMIEDEEKNGMSPDELARILEKIINHPSPTVRYTVGKFEQTFSALFKRLVPASVYERAFMKYYKLL